MTVNVFNPNVGVAGSPEVPHIGESTFRRVAKYLGFQPRAVARFHP